MPFRNHKKAKRVWGEQGNPQKLKLQRQRESAEKGKPPKRGPVFGMSWEELRAAICRRVIS